VEEEGGTVKRVLKNKQLRENSNGRMRMEREKRAFSGRFAGSRKKAL